VAGRLVPLGEQLVPCRAPDLLFRCAFLRELFLEHVLRRDRRVIRPWNPERGIAEHAMPADQNVLQRVHGVTHVQVAGDVRRRHRDREGLAGQALAGLEVAALIPGRIPPLLDGLGVITRIHYRHRADSLRAPGATIRYRSRCLP
jgi:hypothetical protein